MEEDPPSPPLLIVKLRDDMGKARAAAAAAPPGKLRNTFMAQATALQKEIDIELEMAQLKEQASAIVNNFGRTGSLTGAGADEQQQQQQQGTEDDSSSSSSSSSDANDETKVDWSTHTVAVLKRKNPDRVRWPSPMRPTLWTWTRRVCVVCFEFELYPLRIKPPLNHL